MSKKNKDNFVQKIFKLPYDIKDVHTKLKKHKKRTDERTSIWRQGTGGS